MLAWLAYFYVALALREQILVANGSSIRGWWITHHAWSAGTAALVLSLPIDSPAVRVFLTRLLRWSAAQGVVMILQNRYQRRRMYTRIALGRNAAMDVVSGVRVLSFRKKRERESEETKVRKEKLTFFFTKKKSPKKLTQKKKTPGDVRLCGPAPRPLPFPVRPPVRASRRRSADAPSHARRRGLARRLARP